MLNKYITAVILLESSGVFRVSWYAVNAVNIVWYVVGKRLESECEKLKCKYGCREEGAGSYVCFCQSGYVLSADKMTCEGKRNDLFDISNLEGSNYIAVVCTNMFVFVIL